MLLKPLIKDFVSEVRASGKVELYNEAGLRHELASFAERKLPPENYGVQFERKAQAVVLEAGGAVFKNAILDIYIFERAGKGQFCLQVLAQSYHNHSSWAEVPKQVKFLEQLSSHGFQECGLFFAYQPLAIHSKPASGLNFINFEPGYAIEWEELLPASQDNNGPWKYSFIQTNATVKI